MSIEEKNFINEIKSEARRQGLLEFFLKHKKTAIISAISLLSFLILFFIYSIIADNLRDKYSEIFHQSLIEEELQNLGAAKEKLKIIEDAFFAPPSVKGMAALRQAAIALQENEFDDAIKIYKKAAKKSLYNDFVQEIAALNAVKLIVANFDENSDEKTVAKTQKEVNILSSGNKILRPSFYEQQAIFALKAGKKDQAQRFLNKIAADKNAPASLKTRAQDLIKMAN